MSSWTGWSAWFCHASGISAACRGPHLTEEGNYSLGFKDQLMFPEIDYDKVEKPRGFQITIVTTARSDEEGRRLLELMGMPFVKG